jgi:hypothetical protein
MFYFCVHHYLSVTPALYSQSIFDQDINVDGYLSSLIPLEHFLTIETPDNLGEIYIVL